MRNHKPRAVAVLFFVMACAFSVILFPAVSLAAKLAFFATGFGCGVSAAASVRRGSPEK